MSEGTAEKVIKVRPKSKRNEQFLVCLGGVLLIFSMIFDLLVWDLSQIQLILLSLACLLVSFIGVVKILEPQISYFIYPEKIVYVHRSGYWLLPWQDILRVGDVKADIEGEHKELPYLGIKLKNLENIAQNISPRLANKLLHEQQELLNLAAKNEEITFDDCLVNFDPYVLNDVTYQGPVAAWLHRSEQLATAYGYHLFLPDSSLDRDMSDFLSLLKECLEYCRYHPSFVSGHMQD
ncbi:DUF2982 domain-containing protein [Psychromonas ossibalaenae]|uniref:DUF2982 domain-containing protein n=1 Tax=Psychromonas ossibalaenae TaxID=444922 RepID=UPI0003620AA9|nr:DUF2982 domain-containing protein [Psychromonas ossibalaenae]